MFRLEALGGLTIVDQSRARVATQPRRLALLALLAAAEFRGLSRAKLQAYLWPESAADSARHGLEQLVYYLRRQVGPDLFLGPDPLRLNPAVITSDISQFEQALAASRLSEAVSLYRGPFLDGFYLNGAPEFERWVEDERGRLAAACRRGLLQLADKAEAAGRWDEAAGWWRKLVAMDPLSERAALGLMRALVAAGDRTAALVFARNYATLVTSELAAPVPPEISACIARLGTEASPSTAAPLPEPATPLRTLTVPASEEGSSSLGAAARQVDRREPRRAPRLFAIGAGLGALVTLGTLASLALRPTSNTRLDPNLVAVAPFDVLGPGLGLWKEGLVDLLSRHLDGAGQLRTIAPSVIIRHWQGRADRPSTSALAHRTGAGLAVYGSLLRMGVDSARLSATLFDVRADRPIGEIELRGPLSRMDRLIDSLSVRLLTELGRASGIGLRRPARASSLTALKAFLEGEQYYRRMAWDSARAHLERAVALDTTFALALRHLGWLLRWTRNAEDSTVRIYAFRAAAFNHGLPARESLLIVADSLDAALWMPPERVRSKWVEASPLGPHYLHGVRAGFLRAARREIATLREAVRRYPDDPEAWYQLGEALFHLGPKLGVTLQEQLAAFDRAIALDPGFLLAEPHAVSLGIQLGGAALGRRYASAYLARHPHGDQAASVRVVNALLALPASDSARIAERVDSLVADRMFERGGEALGRWPDPAESGLRLMRASLAPKGKLGNAADALVLAQWFASRGHLRAAAALIGSSASLSRPHLFVDVALLGAIPAETAVAVFDRWHADELLSSLSLPWLAAQRDTATLLRVVHEADSSAGFENQEPWKRDSRRYLAQSALAYLALARRDTADAVHRFTALLDSLCLECDFDRLQTAVLLSTTRQDHKAYERLKTVFPAGDIKEPPRPSEILWVLERGKVAERIGDRAAAANAYSWVVGMWRNADPELRSHVAEARVGLARVAPNPTR
jgi:serine/threonine-protein kinase